MLNGTTCLIQRYICYYFSSKVYMTLETNNNLKFVYIVVYLEFTGYTVYLEFTIFRAHYR